jgi:hypothetical protein
MIRTIFLAALCMLLMVGVAAAQGFGPGIGNGVCGFIDEDGDGFNDLAPDADGDGIPNGLDPDYEKPADGTGSQFQYRYGRMGVVGDIAAGIGNAYAHMNAYKGEGPGQGGGMNHSYGPGDGSGTGVGPGDGTGFGPGDGSGDCDGSGENTGGVNARRSGRR